MKFAIIAALATVALAAPAVDVEARQSTVQACACANAAGQTTTGACIYGWGNSYTLADGQQYCIASDPASNGKILELFSSAACSEYPLFPTSVCKSVKVCIAPYGQYPC